MPEDVSGLPDVPGLEAVVRDMVAQDKGPIVQQQAQQAGQQQQVVQPPSQQASGQPQEQLSDFDLSMLNNPKNMLKSYKEIQGYTTRISQENKELRDKIAAIEEENELRKFYPQQPVQQPQYQPQQPNGQQDFTVAVAQQVQTQLIASVLEEEDAKNPEEFQERLAYVRMLAQSPKFAPLASSHRGVRKLFEEADKYRDKDIEKKARASVSKIFGDDIDIDRLRQAFKKDGAQQPNQTNAQQTVHNLALLPDTNTSFRTAQDTNAQRAAFHQERTNAVAQGDPDTVIASIFREALSR